MKRKKLRTQILEKSNDIRSADENNNSVALVSQRTIPTERPPLVAKLVPTFADTGVSRG
jgi:hypothetical protein